jgi:SpoVK/Ycf46/Vps4 family AAA+-type ATPase
MKIIKDKINDLNTNPISKNIKNKRNDLINILYNKDNGISTLQGTSRENIKISLLKNIYMFLKIPHFFFKGFNNFLLTGSAGSGKTKLASVIAFMMNNLGILATNNLVIATKQNLIGEFLGQSAPKTRNLLANALEGVVFIDEAYTLTPCDKSKKDSYSEEAIGELINFIDKFIGCLVIIVAGYKDKMNDCFLTFNEGIARRFPKIIDLIPYSSKDMYNIFETFLNESIEVHKIFTKKQREYMKSIISALNENNVFNNQAGDMLNLSKVIGEDAILFDNKYNNDMIKYSFMKFCATKNIAIDF